MSTNISIEIPAALRPQAGDQSQVDVTADSVKEALDALASQFPALGERLYKDDGQLNRFINIYVNDEDIRFLENLDTPITQGDELAIVPAIAGG